MRVELLAPEDVSAADLAGLGSLLVDCVDGGASVGFLRPLDQRDAEEWWRRAVTSPGSVTWIARDQRSVLGTVQLHKAGQPNGPHRAEVAKLLVRREARGRGCAAALMEALERAAAAEGRTTLVLDTQTGGVAERLYEKWGWRRVGVIAGYALDPDGRPQSTTIFTKTL